MMQNKSDVNYKLNETREASQRERARARTTHKYAAYTQK